MAKGEAKSGAAVDSSGNIAVDPTQNVLQLVDAAVRRINDLHAQEVEFDAKVREVDIKRADDLSSLEKEFIRTLLDRDNKRLDDIRNATVASINEALSEHKEFNKITNSNFLMFADRLSEERELRLTQKFDSLDRAILKADGANEKRFEGVNEFRNALSDQQRMLLPRTEFVASHDGLQILISTNIKTLSDQISANKERIDKLDNLKQGGQNLWILIIGVAAIAMSLISFVLGILGH